jgi:NADPH:quinone reductase
VSTPETALQLRSLVRESELEISLIQVPVTEPAPDEVVVQVRAAPINPSDLGLLFGLADMTTAKATGTQDAPVITARIPRESAQALAGRLNQSLPVGNEGAGVVVKTGASEPARALQGRTVAVLGGAMYSQYRTVKVAQCLPLPSGTTPTEGASCFVNPLTALCMVEAMHREGHSALVHTAAASNLGQMLNRICLKDGVPLVHVVRRKEQADLLRAQGAVHVCDSSSPAFLEDLRQAVQTTGATLAFDAVGGGKLASQILRCMEAAALAKLTEYSRYGSSVPKQVYIYGVLDRGPTVIDRDFGLTWSVGGWTLTPFLQKIGPAAVQKLRERIVAELKSTFASHYAREISLREALDLDVIGAYARIGTGEKFLIDPSRA